MVVTGAGGDGQVAAGGWPPGSEPLISRCCEARPDRRSGQGLGKDPWRGGFGSRLNSESTAQV